jgi:hypothetical protein
VTHHGRVARHHWVAQHRRVQVQLVVQGSVEFVREVEAAEVKEIVRALLDELRTTLDVAIDERTVVSLL